MSHLPRTRPDRRPRPLRAGRAAAVVSLLLAAVAPILAPAPASAQAAEGDAALRRELAAERQMLREDLAAYDRAREAETGAREALAAALQGISSQAAATGPPRGMPALRTELAEAEAQLAAATSRTAGELDSIRDRVRRIALLGAALGAAPPPVVPDVLSGRWQVRIEPVALTGTFDLRQDGTQVSGAYLLDNGRAGSLDGTWVNGLLNLRRIDSETGFDSIFEALRPEPGRLVGTWRPTILSSGGPGGGDWTAVRVATPSGEEPGAEEGEETEEAEAETEEEGASP